MANEKRLRADNVAGTLTGSGVASGATTIDLGSALPSAATPDTNSHLAITLSPGTTTEEIIHITGPATMGTTYPCVKGAEGSTDATHGAVPWLHGPTALDFSTYGLVGQALTTEGDLLVQGAGFTASNPSPTGVTDIGTGSSETVITGMDVTLSTFSTSVPVTVTVDLYTSMNQGGSSKQVRARLRRTNASGTLLADSGTLTMTVDSTAGHDQRWNITYTDSAPTNGHYVVTIERLAGSVDIWSDTRILSATTAIAGPQRVAVGSNGQYVLADSTAGAGVAWSDLLIPRYSADPSSPADGRVWINTTSGLLKVQIGGATKVVTVT